MGKKKKKKVNAKAIAFKKFKKIDVERAEYDYHLPVLLKQACDNLVINKDGHFIDGTLGGGGHTEEILSRLSSRAKLFSFDKDEAAIAHCSKKFWGELSKGSDSRLVLKNECYSAACSILEYWGGIDGILLDLGLSSRQLDDDSRGFSYRVDTKLDMRFGIHGKSVDDILHAAKEEEIIRILRSYGEEPFASRIARRIVQRRRALPFNTTFDLRSVVEESVPLHLKFKSLSRVFQAFRIAANDELDVLQKSLNDCINILNVGARIVIISYHSLEDRIVKNFIKEHTKPKQKYEIDSDDEDTKNMPRLIAINRKPIIPSLDEIAANPRSRSAKMRVAEKT